MDTVTVASLRDKFLKKLADEGPPDSKDFHPADISRIKDGDGWLRRFLEHNENNIQDALKMLWETCKWRRNFGTNDINVHNISKEYLDDGEVFAYGKDKDGKRLFIINAKLHVKGARDFVQLQRIIVYWFERLERETGGDLISVFFDLTDSAFANIDMEFTKYLVGLFKSYYPLFLNYIIILEMPWVMNAAFQIIKSWLPAKAIPKIKFVNKTTVKAFVNPSDILISWGGTNDYTFTFVPEVTTAKLNGVLENKKVHFAESSPTTENAVTGFGDQVDDEKMLSIEPNMVIFNKSGNDFVSSIELKNLTADKCLSYKVKTTSPSKFRVRQSVGILSPSESCTVTIMLQPGYNTRSLLQNERFLVMCLPIGDSKMHGKSSEVVELWKTSGATAKQYKLFCRDGTDAGEMLRGGILTSSEYSNEQSLSILASKVSRMDDHINKLRKDMSILKILLSICITLITLLPIAIFYILRNDNRSSSEDQSCRVYEE